MATSNIPATTGIRNAKGQWVPGTTGNPDGSRLVCKTMKAFQTRLQDKLNETKGNLSQSQYDTICDELIWLCTQRDNLKEKNIALQHLLNRVMGCPKTTMEVDVNQTTEVDPRDVGAVLLSLRGALNGK